MAYDTRYDHQMVCVNPDWGTISCAAWVIPVLWVFELLGGFLTLIEASHHRWQIAIR